MNGDEPGLGGQSEITGNEPGIAPHRDKNLLGANQVGLLRFLNEQGGNVDVWACYEWYKSLKPTYSNYWIHKNVRQMAEMLDRRKLIKRVTWRDDNDRVLWGYRALTSIEE